MWWAKNRARSQAEAKSKPDPTPSSDDKPKVGDQGGRTKHYYWEVVKSETLPYAVRLVGGVVRHPEYECESQEKAEAAIALYEKNLALAKQQKPSTTEPEKAFPADSLKHVLLHIRAGAQARWDGLRENGATNQRIREQIALEFGIYGSHGVPGSPEGYDYAGGKNPRFSANGMSLKGRILVAKVRELLAIPESKIEVEEAKPSTEGL